MRYYLKDIEHRIIIEHEHRFAKLPSGRQINFCHDCECLNPGIYMLKHWPYGLAFLCWECSEKRLGYKLTESHLNDAPCNWALRPKGFASLSEAYMDQRVEALLPRIQKYLINSKVTN